MSVKSMIAAGTLALALGTLPSSAQTLGTPPSPNMPAPAGLPDRTDTVGAADQADQSSLPDTASPLGLIALGGLAALGGAAALRRAR